MILAELGGTLTVTADYSPFLLGDVVVLDETAPVITITVTDPAGIAAAQRFQRLGVRVDYDRGDGTYQSFPDRMLAAGFTIEESASRIGDQLSFSLSGPQFAPLARGLLRANTGIRAYLTYGSPLYEYLALVFSGVVMQAPYTMLPPTADVVCLDAAGRYARRLAKTYNLPPNSGKTRGQMVRELLAIGDIPAGDLDLGENDGGILLKPVALGDRPILVYLPDALAVIGAEIGFENDLLVARRYDPLQPPVVELHAGNLLVTPTLTQPETLAANVIGVVAAATTYTEANGDVTDERSVITTGPYAPQRYEYRQDDGVLTENPGSGFGAEIDQVISETIYRTRKRGSLVIGEEEIERGWYAERAAGSEIKRVGNFPVDGVWPHEIRAVGGTVYIYTDGSTRARFEEQFRDIRRRVLKKELDADQNVVQKREERYRFHMFTKALFSVDLHSGVLVDEPPENWTWLTDEGHGADTATEVFAERGPMEITITDYELADDGTIAAEVVREYTHGTGRAIFRRIGAWGYGIENRVYTNRGEEDKRLSWPTNGGGETSAFANVLTTTTRYRVLGEDTFEKSVSVSLNGAPPTVTDYPPETGAPPFPEHVEPIATTQEIRYGVDDEERIALAGERIEDIEHNEFVQSREEAITYARIRARKAAALKLSCEMPIEGLVHKWRMLRVNLPGTSIHGKRFYVRSVTRDAERFAQTVEAEWYPPQFT